MMSKGWECPKCGRVYSPTWPSCDVCNNKIKGASNIKISDPPPHFLGTITFNNHPFEPSEKDKDVCDKCGVSKWNHAIVNRTENKPS